MRGFFLFLFCLWVLEVSLSHCGTQNFYKTSRRQKLVSQLPVFVHYMCEGGGRGSASTGGSQRLVYRRLEATNMLHRGTVRLHRLHVLVEDGEDLVVEDLVLPNAIRHLLQRLQETGRKLERRKGARSVLHLQSQVTHHVLDDLVFAVLPLHFEEMVAEVKEVEAALLPQQHDDGAAGPVQPIAKALSERWRTGQFKSWKVVMGRKSRKTEKSYLFRGNASHDSQP